MKASTLKIKPTWGKWQSWGSVALVMGVFASTFVVAQAGSTAVREEPIPLAVAQVLAANDVSYLVTEEGELYSQGLNNFGQLGLGSLKNTDSWERVYFTHDDNEPVITKVDSKGEHAIALDSTGAIWTWGSSYSGAQATGSNNPRITPTKMTIAYSFHQIEAGDDFFVALDSQGFVYTWGANDFGQLGREGDALSDPTMLELPDVKIAQITTGKNFALAVDSNGGLWAWGDNANGQFGNDTKTASVTPVKVAEAGWSNIFASRYSDTVLAINTAGELYAWGPNDHALLGNDRDWRQEQVNEDKRIADAIKAIQDADVAEKERLVEALVVEELAAMQTEWKEAKEQWEEENPEPKITDFPPVLTPPIVPTPDPEDEEETEEEPEKTLFEIAHEKWERDRATWNTANPEPRNVDVVPEAKRTEFQAKVERDYTATSTSHLVPEKIKEPTIGKDSLTPVKVASDRQFTSASIGSENAFAIDTEGKLWGWGNDLNGQTGLSYDEKTHTHRPVELAGRNYSSVFAGPTWAIASGADSGLFTWGLNDRANRLQSAEAKLKTPVAIATEKFTKVSGSESTGGAIRDNGTVFTWGANANGMAGQGGEEEAVKLAALEGSFSELVFSKESSLGLSASVGYLYFWGNNPRAFSGIEETTLLTPQPHVISSFIDIAAGRLSSYVVDSNGFVWTWGMNWLSTIGNKGSSLKVPTKITMREPVARIAASQTDVMIVTKSNTVLTWGNQVESDSIVTVSAEEIIASNIVELKAGKSFFLLRDENGSVFEYTTAYPTAYIDGMLEETMFKVELPGEASALGAGGKTAMVVIDGDAYGWGDNSSQQLIPLSKESQFFEPTLLPLPYSGDWNKVAVSETHTIGASSSNVLYGWGSSKYIHGLAGAPVTKPFYSILTEKELEVK